MWVRSLDGETVINLAHVVKIDIDKPSETEIDEYLVTATVPGETYHNISIRTTLTEAVADIAKICSAIGHGDRFLDLV